MDVERTGERLFEITRDPAITGGSSVTRRPRLAPASSPAARRGSLGDPRRSIPRRGTQPLPAGSGSRSPVTAPGASAPSTPARSRRARGQQNAAYRTQVP